MIPWYVFPPEVKSDTTVAHHDTAGWTITAKPASHPANGNPCQLFEIPDGTVDRNGCWLQVYDINGKPRYKGQGMHGALYLSGMPDGAGILIDILPEVSGSSSAPALAPIEPAGRFTLAGGRRLRWRSVTGFQVVEQVAHGRESEAVDFLGWCGEHRVAPRVLAMAFHLFKLRPEEGRAALPRVMELAARAGVYLEITALADTKSYHGMDLDHHVYDVGRTAQGGLCRVEVANEVLPLHSTQDDRLGDLEFLKRLARLVPSAVPVSLGSNHNGADEDPAIAIETQPFSNGYITDHMSRDDGDNAWRWVRHTNELGWLADNYDLDAINDEPQRKDTTPGKHMALAVLCHAIRDIGDTFHYEGGLYARIPHGAELDAFNGREQGWNLVENETWFNHGTYTNAGQGWPVKGFESALRVYSTVQGDHALTLALDAANARIDWHDDAHPTLLASRDGALVYRVTR